MKINFGESFTALAIVAFAAFMAYVGAGYPLGTLQDMGAGYFPMMLSFSTAALGLLAVLQVATSSAPAPTIHWRSAVLVLGAMAAWAFMAERFGLVPASIVLVLMASFAQPPVRIWTAILTAAIVSACAVVIFIYGFNLPLRIVRW